MGYEDIGKIFNQFMMNYMDTVLEAATKFNTKPKTDAEEVIDVTYREITD